MTVTPPEVDATNVNSVQDRVSPAGSQRLSIIKERADFLRAARAPRVATPGFILQIRSRGDDLPARIGFTCSKKVGNAVARNRAKRRLREIARMELPLHGCAGTDYVLIGRATITATRDFDVLRQDLRAALRRGNQPKRR